jgi:hypothetical protein
MVSEPLFSEPARDVEHSALPAGGRVAQLAGCDRRLSKRVKREYAPFRFGHPRGTVAELLP